MSSKDIYQSTIPYTYFIRWNDLDLNYYGRRTAKRCHPNELFISYFTSSDLVKEIISEYGYPDHIIVHRIFSDTKSCCEQEEKYLKRVNAAKNPKFLNKTNGDKKFDATGLDPVRYADTQEKCEKTNRKKYGANYYLHTNECQEKIVSNYREKYGVDHHMQTEKSKEKFRNSNQEKYGVDWFLQSEECKEKIKQTNQEKYGVTCYIQSEDFKEKRINSNKEKYGASHHMQTDEYKQKYKQANKEKYGVEHYFNTEEYKEKTKNFYLTNYGVDHPAKIPFVSIIETKKTYNKTNAKRWLKDLIPYF